MYGYMLKNSDDTSLCCNIALYLTNFYVCLLGWERLTESVFFKDYLLL